MVSFNVIKVLKLLERKKYTVNVYLKRGKHGSPYQNDIIHVFYSIILFILLCSFKGDLNARKPTLCILNGM